MYHIYCHQCSESDGSPDNHCVAAFNCHRVNTVITILADQFVCVRLWLLFVSHQTDFQLRRATIVAYLQQLKQIWLHRTEDYEMLRKNKVQMMFMDEKFRVEWLKANVNMPIYKVITTLVISHIVLDLHLGLWRKFCDCSLYHLTTSQRILKCVELTFSTTSNWMPEI